VLKTADNANVNKGEEGLGLFEKPTPGFMGERANAFTHLQLRLRNN
jgi:hypothetical protein